MAKVLWFLSISLVWLAPYFAINSWNMPLATAVILALTYKKASANGLTLKKAWTQIPLLTALGMVTWLSAQALIHFWAFDLQMTLNADRWVGWLSTRAIFQVFNEEWILRAGFLAVLEKMRQNYFQKIRPTTFLWIHAGFFSLAHFILYWSKDGTILDLITLGTIMVFGLLCNLLLIHNKTIWYGFSLHLGWNLARFQIDWIHQGRRLPEAETYKLIEGNASVLLLLLWITLLYSLFRALFSRVFNFQNL